MVKKVKCIDNIGFEHRLTYGKHYKVISKFSNPNGSFYEIENDNGENTYFLKNRFKEIKEEEMFTKDDLLDGDKLTDRDGDLWYVCGDNLCCISREATWDLNEWNSDLSNKDFDNANIMKVERRCEVIWEREEISKELSKEKEKLQKVISKLQADLDDAKAKLDNL